MLDLARCEWIERRENVILSEACLRQDALGPRGSGKTHVALGQGWAACQKGLSVNVVTAAFAMGLGPVAAPWLTRQAEGGPREMAPKHADQPWPRGAATHFHPERKDQTGRFLHRRMAGSCFALGLWGKRNMRRTVFASAASGRSIPRRCPAWWSRPGTRGKNGLCAAPPSASEALAQRMPGPITAPAAGPARR